MLIIQAMLMLIIRAVTHGKVATNRMKKQSVAISAVLGIFPDLEPFELLGKPL
jgi:hypothetical protein